MADHFEGASVKERLVEACRRNNVELLSEIIKGCRNESEISDLMNNTTTVMGNHLYHEAALQGNYEIIDMLLDQPEFECDPINRAEGDTPLHSAIRWINSEPPAQREFGNALVEMMLEAGSSTRIKNKAKLTPYQLVDPRNTGLRQLILKHEYASLNAGDFVNADEIQKPKATATATTKGTANNAHAPPVPAAKAESEDDDDDDDEAEFSGSDEEERAEWERRRKAKGGR
ncbi:ankyrin repeat domain-containing protein [Xylaria sp. CBS 124048]|nr:ankyrin repeat domain-containing protein [Xylaria sp. CBS 124048]